MKTTNRLKSRLKVFLGDEGDGSTASYLLCKHKNPSLILPQNSCLIKAESACNGSFGEVKTGDYPSTCCPVNLVYRFERPYLKSKRKYVTKE